MTKLKTSLCKQAIQIQIMAVKIELITCALSIMSTNKYCTIYDLENKYVGLWPVHQRTQTAYITCKRFIAPYTLHPKNKARRKRAF